MIGETIGRGMIKGALRALAAAALAAGVVTAQAVPVSGQGTWETTLQGRDINGNPVPLLVSGSPNPAAAFYYDTTLDLIWLANWNANGTMTWDIANAWAAGLNPGGFTGWVLPWVTDTGTSGCNMSFAGGTDCGYYVYGLANMGQSPLAHMWYVTLGNLAWCPPGDIDCSPAPQAGWGLSNTGPFSNMQSWYYWSGTAYAPPPSSTAWAFGAGVGVQGPNGNSGKLLAVAVRPGDVFAGSVSEPGTLAVLLTGLGALALAWRRRTH